MPSPWVLALLALAVAKTLAEIGLAALNLRELRRWEAGPPADLADLTTPDKHRRTTAYTRAKLSFGMVEEIWSLLLLAALLLVGVGPWTQAAIAGPTAPLWKEVSWLIAVFAGIALAGLPFDAWGTFRIEQHFGFNRTTVKLWLGDKLKESLIGVALAFPLLWLLLALVGWAGSLWWLWGWLVFLGWQALMIVLYPKFILPVFNKLTPLPDGELRARLTFLAERAGFPAGRIEVMDGSRRSGHSNAFFTGFGKARRIVLYDTLIAQIPPLELEAVLAHEIGHYKRGHILRMLALSAIMTGACFATIGWIASSSTMLATFGFTTTTLPAPAPAFYLVGLGAGVLGFWLGPLLHSLSRKHEYEADAYARGLMGGPEPLISALKKLQQENAANLTPHPLYSAVHYSHPALRERLAALQRAE